MLSTSEKDRLTCLLDLLPPTINSLHTALQVIRYNPDKSQDTKKLLSLFATEYKYKYGVLPIYSQHILNALSTSDKGLQISEVRDLTNLPNNILTVYLKGLSNHDMLITDKSIPKHTTYSIKDKLFRLWLAQTEAKS